MLWKNKDFCSLLRKYKESNIEICQSEGFTLLVIFRQYFKFLIKTISNTKQFQE